MKPKDAQEALTSLAPYLNKDATIISVIAGINIQTIINALGNRPVARVMPNTSAAVGMSASALCWNELISDESKLLIIDLLESIGSVKVVEEDDLHVVTALSGSGPAYLYYFAEQFESAAVQHGLDSGDARQLFIQTMEGAAQMLKKGDVEPSELRRRVTSPGGTTEAGLEQLMEHKVVKLYLLVSMLQKTDLERFGKILRNVISTGYIKDVDNMDNSYFVGWGTLPLSMQVLHKVKIEVD